MRKFSVINLSITAALLSGCALFSPAYNKPVIEQPTTTRSGIAIESSDVDLSKMEWWKKVNDPVLNQLMIIALTNNAQIQTAHGNIMQAQASLKAAQYSWLPTLSGLGGGFVGGNFLTDVNSSYTPGAITSSGFNGAFGGFLPSYSFNVFANISQTKLAKATLDMQRAAYNATRLTIINQISNGYFTLLAQKKQLIVQQQQIDDAKELRRLEAIQVQKGAADLADLISYDQTIAGYEANIPSIENSIAQTENAIKVLINQNPGPIITDGSIDKLNIESIIPANIPSSVLKNRPDIIQAEDSLKIANANIAVANSKFFPSINITGFAGGMTEALSTLLNMSTGIWTIVGVASMPIIDAATYEQVDAAEGGYYAQYYSYINTVKSAFQNVDNNLTNKANMDKVYNKTYQSYQLADANYKINLVQYNVGNAAMTNVLQAKISLDGANLNLIQAKAQQLTAVSQVFDALAVGYAAESELSKPKKIK